MKSMVVTVMVLPSAAVLYAQVPSKCLEIESILVDACIADVNCGGSTEGMNEMVRFITGAAPIAVGELEFAFFSSSFQGISQNSTTADLTAQLNASILGCGQLLEPPGGIIPPGSQVIFVTSTAMCVQANSFAALNDTLYIIFQNAGNSQGHFKNNNLVGQPATTAPGPPLERWLRISVAGTGCGDTATYDANQLVNIYGTYGGASAENDGATVEFSWPGPASATYVNHGCMAAFEATLPSIISGGGPLSCGDTAMLAGSVTGPFASVHWQGGLGSFSDATAMTTNYVPGEGESGDVQLSFCAVTNCGDTLCTLTTVMVAPLPVAAFSWAPLDQSSPGNGIQFQDHSVGATAWTWLFGDPITGADSLASPVFTFPGEGCWPVSLTIANDAGCTDTALAEVCITGGDSLAVPNIFTPNNDGVNDAFRITGGDLASLHLQVFNRWGQEVALLERTGQVWDGRSPAGTALSEGTYFYTLRAVGNDARTYDFNGTITLLR